AGGGHRGDIGSRLPVEGLLADDRTSAHESRIARGVRGSGRARNDDQELTREITLSGQHRSRLHVDRAEERGDSSQLALRAPPEQLDAVEQLDLRMRVASEHDSVLVAVSTNSVRP